MIQGFKNYNNVEVNEFTESEKLKLGGHICKILGVEIEQIISKKDNKQYTMLKLKFDIEAPDEQAGFYQRKFVDAAKKDAMNAKWKGYHKITIPDDTSIDFIQTTWKTFLTSVEKSNPGVVLDGEKGFDENILVGKLFAGVFGLEEFKLDDGKVITFPRIRFVRSTENVDKISIPKVKLLDGTFVEYDDYMEKKEEEKENNSSNTSSELGKIESSDDLPF